MAGGDNIQAPKDNIRQSILSEAKAEFFNRGFHRANVRNIAKRCGISVGNIYNYFSGKNDILHELVSPTVSIIEKLLTDYGNREILKRPEVWGHDYHISMAEHIAVFLDHNREALSLLFFHSHGSDYEDFRDNIAEKFTESWIQFFTWLNEEYPDNGVHVSDFFLHNMASFYLNIAAEILMHNISYSDMITYLEEIMEFAFQGWKPLMNWYKFLPWDVE